MSLGLGRGGPSSRAGALRIATLSWVLVTPLASAQDLAVEAARRDLLAQAAEAAAHDDHARARALGEQAGRLRMTPSLRLFLAEESERESDWLAAYAHATLCRGEVTAASGVPHRERILARCARVEGRVGGRVAFVTLHAPPDVEGLRVRVAGAEVPAAAWGTRYPVAARPLVVEASAGDGRTFREEITLTEGQAREVRVALSDPAPPPPPPAPPRSAPVASTPPAAMAEPQAPRSAGALPEATGPGLAPWGVAGAGALILASAGVFYALRQSSLSTRDEACTAARCDDAGEQRALAANADAHTWTTLTNVALGVGAAAVVGGVTWWLLARPARRTTTAWIAPQESGVAVGVGGAL